RLHSPARDTPRLRTREQGTERGPARAHDHRDPAREHLIPELAIPTAAAAARCARPRLVTAPPPVVSMRHATVRINGRNIWADVDFEIAASEFVAVLGPNGVGKSTLIKALLGQIPLATGYLRVLDHAPGRANHDIGY